MARPGDKGAYEVGNVRICLAEENRAERNQNYTLNGEHNHWHGKNPWLSFKNPETAKAKKRRSMIIIAAKRERDTYGRFVSKGIA